MSTSSFLRFDFGSSTLKAYHQQGEKLSLLGAHTIPLKESYKQKGKIDNTLLKKVSKILRSYQRTYPRAKGLLYGTAFFRSVSIPERRHIVDTLFAATGWVLQVISADLEAFYLEKALIGRCTIDEPILLLNIGGGSTELVVVKNQKVQEKHLLEMGVGHLLAEFPQVNEPYAGFTVSEVVTSLRKLLPRLKTQPRAVLYSGGELTFMRRLDYPLVPNTLFSDLNHPVMLAQIDFAQTNEKLFEEYTLDDLYQRMPENPQWMQGARLCSALAQAVVEQYQIPTIIPSDVNLVDGLVQQELRTVVISGSFRKHLTEITALKNTLLAKGSIVLSPRFTAARNPGAEFVTFAGEEKASPLELERYHLQTIQEADALIVCCPGGYVGASALIEIGYAQCLEKRILFTEQPEEFMLQTLPAEVGLPW